MAQVRLQSDHTCNCGPCIEVPKLFQENKDISALKDHHTCDCDACIANIGALVDTKAIATLKEDHTCGCSACTDIQKSLAQAA